MKTLIVGNNLSHDTTVKNSYLTAYPNGGWEFYTASSLTQAIVDYARTNNFNAIIYSYSGEESYFSLANSNPDIMIFMPSDSYSGDLQQLVLCDDLPSTDDYEFAVDTDSQSNSNGYICGQLCYIASRRNCSLQEARLCANFTKNEDGIIDINSAIAYSGIIKLSVGSISAERTDGLNVTITLERIIDASRYVIQVYEDGVFVKNIETTSLINYYVLPDYGNYVFYYYGANIFFCSDVSAGNKVDYPAISYIVWGYEMANIAVENENSLSKIISKAVVFIGVPSPDEEYNEDSVKWYQDVEEWDEGNTTWSEQ